MKFKIRFADQIVGIFVLVAIVCVAVILISIGGQSAVVRQELPLHEPFLSGDGLSSGMPIMLKGFEIGRISRISLNAQNQVDVRFYVQDTYYDRVKPNSVLELTSSSIGLGAVAPIPPGQQPVPAAARGVFHTLTGQRRGPTARGAEPGGDSQGRGRDRVGDRQAQSPAGRGAPDRGRDQARGHLRG